MNFIKPDTKPVEVFLAGGITQCPDWQEDVRRWMISNFDAPNIVIYSPRCDNFDITNPDATLNQIKWEFEHIEACDIFSIYFCDSESVQPICFYELGRNMVRMKEKFPDDAHERIIISVDPNFKRKEDVLIQSKLAGFEAKERSVEEHASKIAKAILYTVHKDIILSNKEPDLKIILKASED